MTRAEIYRTALALIQRPAKPKAAQQTAPLADVLRGLRAYSAPANPNHTIEIEV